MSEIILENNEFLRQFEAKVSDSLARIEYAEQERKIFLTKIHIPDNLKDKSSLILLSGVVSYLYLFSSLLNIFFFNFLSISESILLAIL